MNTKELYAALEQAGWSFASAIEKTGVSWYAHRRLIGGKNCWCNDKPPSICIKPWSIDITNQFQPKMWEAVEISVSGQTHKGDWVDFKVYGVKFDDVMGSIEQHTNTLRTAWNSVVGEQS